MTCARVHVKQWCCDCKHGKPVKKKASLTTLTKKNATSGLVIAIPMAVKVGSEVLSIYVYIYIPGHTHTHRERERERERPVQTQVRMRARHRLNIPPTYTGFLAFASLDPVVYSPHQHVAEFLQRYVRKCTSHP